MMDLNKATRHYYAIELRNDERLEVAALMETLKDEGMLPLNMNMGQFLRECFARGYNDYRKDLVRND